MPLEIASSIISVKKYLVLDKTYPELPEMEGLDRHFL